MAHRTFDNFSIPIKPASAIRAVLLALTLAVVPAVDAADKPAPPATPADRSETAAEPKCVHGCERWGKFCNVDPRGVYKCRRRCEKFGEICE